MGLGLFFGDVEVVELVDDKFVWGEFGYVGCFDGFEGCCFVVCGVVEFLFCCEVGCV